jgi:hypothetical protein
MAEHDAIQADPMRLAKDVSGAQPKIVARSLKAFAPSRY